MSTVVRFSPDLSAWLVENLNQGMAPAELVRIMIEERMDPRVARAIVDAFVLARQQGKPLPVDAVELEDAPPEFEYEAPIAPLLPRFRVGERVIPVLLRQEQPRLSVLGNVLDASECAKLIELARPRLQPSTVVNPASGKDEVVAHRTSFGMFFRLGESPFIAELDARISALMNLPVENGEGFQVLRYPEGAETTAHFDFVLLTNDSSRASVARSGQRVSTLIAYLNDVEAGGETTFPRVGLSVTPQVGNAVYFEYCNSKNQVDHLSLHAGNPVTRGEKWVLTKWMRQKRFVAAGSAGSEGMF